MSPHSPFSDPEAVARYAEGPPRLVPGFAGLLRMATLLLEEHTPPNGRVLVLGAGGGLELRAFAEARSDWQFDGVDPAGEMLKQARSTLGELASQVRLHEGYIDAAPRGPFDAATCLLTLHFLSHEERRHTLGQVHERLKAGAPFVVAHLSFPQDEPERAVWLSRYAAFAAASGIEASKVQTARAAIGNQLPILAPEHDEAMLHDAGFSNVSLFYAGFAFRGWVAYA